MIRMWMGFLAGIKGLLMMVIITSLAETSFWNSLAIAVCSATITGIFLVVASILGSKHTTEKVDELKDKVEAQTADASRGS